MPGEGTWPDALGRWRHTPLDRAAFLTAVNGHVPTLESASRLVGDLRAENAAATATPGTD